MTMTAKRRRWLWPVVGGLLALAALPLFAERSRAVIETVIVENFPRLQEVFGEVRVKDPIPHTAFTSKEGHDVPGGSALRPQDLLAVGTIATDGYTRAVLSISGETGSGDHHPGRVGAVLVPDVAPVRTAFAAGVLHHPLIVAATLSEDSPRRYSAQVELPIGFPAYRAYLFNELDTVVVTHLHVYLTH